MECFVVTYKYDGDVRKVRVHGLGKDNAVEFFLSKIIGVGEGDIISVEDASGCSEVSEMQPRIEVVEVNSREAERGSVPDKKAGGLRLIREWYSGVTNKQRVILLMVAFFLSAVPFIGWFLIAPWMLPLVAYLEFHRS
jgi:hypothetical protein